MSTKEQIIELFKELNDKDKSILLNELGDLKSNKEQIKVDNIGNCQPCLRRRDRLSGSCI